ncbi:PLP-dependent aminotransferase family protein [Niallia sp. Man26]|uniref:MocR-like pyridoxine biosynthesis transcription factor PdxR n=1 Tax=Niallia sp. Man26 TaxID=2912824 RepID=UPI001ED9C72C|nr:PLP-dependent aminotransferase family protein [Niallia sp. Man26]UPO89810.1 PLP-dependent aminotransferase family protein [Niallia sp. Man26]
MDWKPDKSKGKAVYKQIVEHIEQGIQNGLFPIDKPLPSERKLAEAYKVNRSTIVAAYSELEANGLVERKRGSGTIVSKDIWGLTKRRIPSWNKYIERGSFQANMPVAQRIRHISEESSLVNFASGELSNELMPEDYVKKIINSKSFTGHLGYDHPQGNIELRKTISDHVKQDKGIETTPNSILITSGAQQAIHLIIECLLKPGDAVVIENPSYHYSLPIFKSAGLKVFHLDVGKEGINPEELIDLHKKHQIKMIFLNPIFQNPTGMILPAAKRKRILDISSEFGIPIVEDDPYSLLNYTEEDTNTLKSLDENGNVLYISSLTKIAASGFRIGWVIGPTPVIERLADAKQQFDFGHSVFSQWIGTEFLRSDYFTEHIEALKSKLEQKRDIMIDSIAEILGEQVDYYFPHGGIHLWCRLTGGMDEIRLLEQSIEEGVIFTPGSILGTKSGYMRLTYGKVDDQEIPVGINRLAKALRKITST